MMYSLNNVFVKSVGVVI